MIIYKLITFKLFFSTLTRESCNSPTPPPPEKDGERNQNQKTLLLRSAKVGFWLVVFHCQKLSNFPLPPLYLCLCWLLSSGNPAGFSVNRVGRKGFCSGEGREEAFPCLWLNQNIRKGEHRLQSQVLLLRNGSSGQCRTTNNKGVETGQAAGGTGAERGPSSMPR